MAKLESGIFLKLAIDEKTALPNGLIASSRKDEVMNWKPKWQTPNKEENEVPEAQRTHPFRSLTEDLLKGNESFFATIPLLLRLVPFALSVDLDKKIRRFAQEHSIDKDINSNIEFYELASQDVPELFKRLDKFESLNRGAAILPSMIFMGLVAWYDSFLANLAKTIILRHPEIISSSEKNISIADLFEIGSLEEAKESIIEQEVDRLMRKSHSEQIEWIEKNIKAKIIAGNTLWPGYIEIPDYPDVSSGDMT
jgi:hypothetical protein